MSNLQKLNDGLKAKVVSTANLDVLNAQVVKSQDANILNSSTVLGKNVEVDVNGFKSLDNNSKGDTTSSLSQILPTAGVYPKTDPSKMITDVGVPSVTVTNVATQVTEFVLDGSGLPTEDSAGNLITQLVDGALVPTVVQIGENLPSTIPEITKSLTGIVPPIESITIVSLGGSALDELAGAIEDASERKGTLLSSIKETASAAKAGGDALGDSITEGIGNVQSKLDEVADKAKSGSLLTEVASAVSAVEGVGDSIASAAASVTGTLTSALKTGLDEAKGIISDKFDSITSSIGSAVTDLVNGVSSDINLGFGTAQDLFEDVTGSVGSALTGLFGAGESLDKDFLSGIMNDVMSGGDINLSKAMKTLTLKDKSLSPGMRKVIQETEAGSVEEFNQTVNSKARAAGISESELQNFNNQSTKIEDALSLVDTTIAGSVVSEAGEFYTEDLDLLELSKRYSAGYIREFSYVDSKEELGLEFVRMTREVSEVIIHASETYTNANIGAEEIQLRHNDAGHLGIQYHFVIRRDGTMQRGLPVDNVAQASDINRHKFNCIDVCLVGGVNVPSEADNPLLNLSASSFTISQMKTLETLLELFYQTVPGGQVLGHNDIDISSQDPYFDVISFVENKFGKKTVYSDPLTETSLDRNGLKLKKAV
jgi:N-acetylmuramoyl-L-alanine amidase